MNFKRFENRKFVIGSFFSAIIILFVFRLFSIQVIDDSYKTSSENNVLIKQVDYPSRGLIYDRNGTLIVYNEAAYDIMVTPKLAKNINYDLMSVILNTDTLDLKKRIEKAKNYSKYKSSIFMKQISVEKS